MLTTWPSETAGAGRMSSAAPAEYTWPGQRGQTRSDAALSAGLGRVAADLDLRAVQLAAAGRAVQDGMELAVAAGVGEQRGRPFGRAEPPVAPLEHHHDVREERATLV